MFDGEGINSPRCRPYCRIEIGRAVKQSFPYPGVPATADGSAAVVWVETHVTQGDNLVTTRLNLARGFDGSQKDSMSLSAGQQSQKTAAF
jgi:hypothetical protein